MDNLTVEVADSIRSSIDSEALARRAIRATIQHLVTRVDLMGTEGDPDIPPDHWLAAMHHVRAMLVTEMEDVLGGQGESAPLF